MEIGKKYLFSASTYLKDIYTCVYVSKGGDAVLEWNERLKIVPWENEHLWREVQ